VGTVSHYLNHPEIVSPGKSQRIREAIDALGFVPNNAGRQLRLGASAAIGFIVPGIVDSFPGVIADGIERRAAERGVSVFIANSGDDPSRVEDYLNVFEQYQVRGLLVAGAGSITAEVELEARLSPIRSRGTASVVVGRRAESPAQSSISVDVGAGSRLAAAHLVQLGSRRLAIVLGPDPVMASARLAGAIAAVRGSARLEVVETGLGQAGGRTAVRRLLGRPEHARPDGILAADLQIGEGIVRELASSSIEIPVSTTTADPDGFGAAAVDLLFAAIAGGAGFSSRLELAPRLVVLQGQRPAVTPESRAIAADSALTFHAI
jgi:LacI family transcriptional regulator